MDERGAARVGGQAAHPGATERLHEYWVHGEGAAKIRWGDAGDFDRCVAGQMPSASWCAFAQ